MPYAVSSEERVNAYTQSRQSAPQTVALPDGGYLIIWSGAGQADQGYGIYLQRFNAAGERVGAETLVNSTTIYSQQNPEVTVLSSGGYVVAWDSIVPGGQPGDPAAIGVFVQAFDAAGARSGGETQVSGAGHSQRVAALPDGGFAVTWTQQLEYPTSSVLARLFDASGQARGPAEVLDNDFDSGYSSVAATDDGFIVVWRASSASGAATIAIQSVDADGGRTAATVHIPRDGDRTYPEVVALADGGFALVWLEATGLFGQILDGGGQPAGDRFAVGPANGGQLLHTLIATPDGGFTVAWDRYSGAGPHVLEARAFFADGRANGETITIRNATGSAGEPPGLTLLASGEVVLTYARYVGNITDYFDVFQVRLEPVTVTQRGSEADEVLTGRAAADRLIGLDGADHLLGLDGDDFLIGGRGNDILDGGGGRDEAVFAGPAANYRIFQDGAGFRVKGPDGFDQLIDIEQLRFDDRVVDLLRIICDPATGAVSFGEDPQTSPPQDIASGKPHGPSPVPWPALPDHGAPGLLPPDNLDDHELSWSGPADGGPFGMAEVLIARLSLAAVQEGAPAPPAHLEIRDSWPEWGW